MKKIKLLIILGCMLTLFGIGNVLAGDFAVAISGYSTHPTIYYANTDGGVALYTYSVDFPTEYYYLNILKDKVTSTHDIIVGATLNMYETPVQGTVSEPAYLNLKLRSKTYHSLNNYSGRIW